MTGQDGKFTFGGVPSGKWAIYYEDSEKLGDWIRATMVNVTGQDATMGMISVILPIIRISVDYEDEASKWDIRRAYLQEGNEYWGREIAKLSKPAEENGPYIIKNVSPGEYYLVLMRQDYLMLRHPVNVTEGEVSTAVRIPKCTAGIKGVISGKIIIGQTIWTRDKSIVASLMPDEKGSFKLGNLPTGHYYVGGNMLIDSEALLEFDLAEGEQKELDISVPDNPFENKERGVLIAMALDENGSPLLGAEASLLGDKGVIEPMIDSSQGIYFMAKQGTYTLQVDYPGYKAVMRQVSIEKVTPKNIQALRKPVFVRLEKQ
jgi:hypothetical protein